MATRAQQNELGFAASPKDTATWAQQNERGFAASPIDTAMPEDKQRLRLCSFPHRHGDVSAAKRTIHYYFVLQLQSLHKHVPLLLCTTKLAQVLLCTTKLAQTTSQYYCVLQSLQKLLASHKDTATWAQQNKRGFAASPIDTATPEDKQRLNFCSFPHRHSDVSAAKRTRFCRFPYRHGDARGQAETDVLQLPP